MNIDRNEKSHLIIVQSEKKYDAIEQPHNDLIGLKEIGKEKQI